MKTRNVRSIVLLAASVFTVCASIVACGGGAQDECGSSANHVAAGEQLISAANYGNAYIEFSCAIKVNAQDLRAYQGRIDASLLSGKYSNALSDYTEIMRVVIPKSPNALVELNDMYSKALSTSPASLRHLIGMSFGLWRSYQTDEALLQIEKILRIDPKNHFGHLFYGSSKFEKGEQKAGEDSFAQALATLPVSADTHFIVADAYLYSLGDYKRALESVRKAVELGLDTPRTDAIFATTYFNLGDLQKSLEYLTKHIERVSAETVIVAPLARGGTQSLNVVPNTKFKIPMSIQAAQNIRVEASSVDSIDSMMLLIDPNGKVVAGNDDLVGFNAGIETSITSIGNYTLVLATFEGAGLGRVTVTWK